VDFSFSYPILRKCCTKLKFSKLKFLRVDIFERKADFFEIGDENFKKYTHIALS